MIPMLSLTFISSHGIILLRVLFQLIQNIPFKCFDHLLVEQTLAWINDLKNFVQHAILLIPLINLMTTSLCFISDVRVGDVKTNGSIALISAI